MLLDSGGTGLVLVVPPNHAGVVVDRLGFRMKSLQDVATRTAGASRGDFKVLRVGSHRGPGAKVGIQLGI